MNKALESQDFGPLNREHAFMRTFVIESRVERSILEIDSKKRKKYFFSRLCHSFREVLRMEVAESFSANAGGMVQLGRLLNQLGVPERCYVMSFHVEIDRQTVTLKEGLDYLENFGMPVILIFTDALAVFKGEQEVGSAPLFLLRSNRYPRHG